MCTWYHSGPLMPPPLCAASVGDGMLAFQIPAEKRDLYHARGHGGEATMTCAQKIAAYVHCAPAWHMASWHRQANPPLLLPRLPSWRVPVNSVKGLPRQSGLLVISSQLSKISNPGSHY